MPSWQSLPILNQLLKRLRRVSENRVNLNVGGKTDDMHGEPVTLEAYVKTISDGVYVRKGPMAKGAVDRMGRTAVVKTGGIEVILNRGTITAV